MNELTLLPANGVISAAGPNKACGHRDLVTRSGAGAWIHSAAACQWKQNSASLRFIWGAKAHAQSRGCFRRSSQPWPTVGLSLVTGMAISQSCCRCRKARPPGNGCRADAAIYQLTDMRHLLANEPKTPRLQYWHVDAGSWVHLDRLAC